MKKTDVRNGGSDQAERERLLRKLTIVATLFLFPAMVIWVLGETLGWVTHSFEVHTFWDGLVVVFFLAGFMYYGLIVHVLADRIRWETWVRHLLIAAPLMASALLLSTLHFSGATLEIARRISSVIHLSSGAVDVLSTVVGWVFSGVAGNLAYDLLKRQIRKSKEDEKPNRNSKRKKRS